MEIVGVREKDTDWSLCHFSSVNCMCLKCCNVSRWGVSQLCALCVDIYTHTYIYEVLQHLIPQGCAEALPTTHVGSVWVRGWHQWWEGMSDWSNTGIPKTTWDVHMFSEQSHSLRLCCIWWQPQDTLSKVVVSSYLKPHSSEISKQIFSGIWTSNVLST